MFAGHVGAALAIGRAERQVNVGVFIAAALFLDALSWLFVLVGWESIILPADIARTHQPEYVFPCSHGLVASLAWSAATGAVAFVAYRRLGAAKVRIALLVAAAVFSHWLLDALVHRPELPLVGSDSPKVGLGLWSSLPTALCMEVAILAIGFCLFVPGCRMSRGRRLAFTVLSLVIPVATVWHDHRTASTLPRGHGCQFGGDHRIGLRLGGMVGKAASRRARLASATDLDEDALEMASQMDE